MNFKTIFFNAVLAISSAFALQAYAAGGGFSGGATEITQLENNGQLVLQEANQAQMVATQLQQYKAELMQLSQMNPEAILSNGSGVLQQLQNVQQILPAIQGIQQSYAVAGQTLLRRVQQMRALSVTPSNYLALESQLAQQKGGVYQQQLSADMNNLQVAQQEGTNLANMGNQIGSVSGSVQGLQLLAQQNQVIAGQLIQMNSNISQGNALAHQQQINDANSAAATASSASADSARSQADVKAIQDDEVKSRGMVNSSQIFKQTFPGAQKGGN